MDMTGERRISASRKVVWAALNDVAVLKQCIPGCELLEKQSDTDMVARAKLQIGPVKATFNGKVKLSDHPMGTAFPATAAAVWRAMPRVARSCALPMTVETP
jgi:carbon monoxide dehydrogenase subunit G